MVDRRDQGKELSDGNEDREKKANSASLNPISNYLYISWGLSSAL